VTRGPHRYRRHPDAWLAGVCADLAQRLGWNVLALRALAVLGLFIHALGTGALYLLLAVLLPLLRTGEEEQQPETLAAPELGNRSARIAELERRFKDLEKGSGPGKP
jgi:phage shock protein PspC (stress-responsive transcriptional regulator)